MAAEDEDVGFYLCFGEACQAGFWFQVLGGTEIYKSIQINSTCKMLNFEVSQGITLFLLK